MPDAKNGSNETVEGYYFSNAQQYFDLFPAGTLNCTLASITFSINVASNC